MQNTKIFNTWPKWDRNWELEITCTVIKKNNFNSRDINTNSNSNEKVNLLNFYAITQYKSLTDKFILFITSHIGSCSGLEILSNGYKIIMFYRTFSLQPTNLYRSHLKYFAFESWSKKKVCHLGSKNFSFFNFSWKIEKKSFFTYIDFL